MIINVVAFIIHSDGTVTSMFYVNNHQDGWKRFKVSSVHANGPIMLPLHVVNKILIMRPKHPVATLLQNLACWSLFRESVEAYIDF